MKKPFPKIRYVAIILLGITLFGFARILPLPAAYSLGAPQPILQAASTATPPGGQLIEPTNTPTPIVAFPTESAGTSIFAFMTAPKGPLAQPYVTITAFQAGVYSTDISIDGTINSTGFICPGSPCTFPLQLGESRFIFRAQTATGITGETVFATVIAELRSDGYYVTITSISQFARSFQDSCLNEWGVQDTEGPSWAEFPQTPNQLHTAIELHHLAARLITYGVVDTRDCPAGGLSQDLDWPNACGLEKVHDQMVYWQNQFDEAIWTSGNQVGIPPKIIKALIMVESQFWPGNERYYVDEYGLGQINQLGVDVLLRNNYDLYRQACSAVMTDCLVPYMSLSAAQQAQVRGALMASLNANCTTCAFGIDLTRAKQSIQFISQVLRSNCDQAKTLVEGRSATTDYESYWKFTMLSYHSGAACLAQALANTKTLGDPIDWEHVAPNIDCPGGRKYVDGFWANLGLIDTTAPPSDASPIVIYTPIVNPTPTAQPSPTPVISNAKVQVSVYMDANGNGTPEPNEGLNGIPVQLAGFPDGHVMNATTQNGQATFDLSGTVTGTQITATLPGLFRNYQFFLPQTGTVPIVFTFAQPTLPATSP